MGDIAHIGLLMLRAPGAKNSQPLPPRISLLISAPFFSALADSALLIVTIAGQGVNENACVLVMRALSALVLSMEVSVVSFISVLGPAIAVVMAMVMARPVARERRLALREAASFVSPSAH